MNTTVFEDRDEWLNARLGRITGSRVKDIIVKRGTEEKMGFYELIAERLGIPADDESDMQRGQRLEPMAMEELAKATGIEFDTRLILWSREDNEGIAISPDGVGVGKPVAAECKCLSSARHIQAWLTQKIPKEYMEQAKQYFVVNDELEELYFAFYDPRLIAKPFFYFVVKREEVAEEVAWLKAEQTVKLREVERIVNELSGY